MCGLHSSSVGRHCRRWREILWLTLPLRRFPGSGSWFLHWRAASTQWCPHPPVMLPSPMYGLMKALCGEFGDVSWDTTLTVGEHLFEEGCGSPFPWPGSVHRLRLTEKGYSSHYISSLDKKTSGCLFKTGSSESSEPGLSQLAFRFTCNHDNSLDASCHGT